MNSKQIDCALELAQTLNFNRAAENLFISQPTLSYHIRTLEEELGFQLFERSGRGAALTLAGRQFCQSLLSLRTQFHHVLDSCRNLSSAYSDVIRIFLPTRTSIYFLSDAIRKFNEIHPDIFVDITIDLQPERYMQFLQGEYDILFGLKSALPQSKDVEQHHLYDSHLYVVTNFTHPLARRERVSIDDLEGETLIVGSASPKELEAVQHRVLDTHSLTTVHSVTHDTTLMYILSNRGIGIIPGLLNDFNDEFAWIPLDCEETLSCVLCTHRASTKESVHEFLQILQTFYDENTTVPL